MSTPAIIFSIYFFIGCILMIVALATRSKECRANSACLPTASELDAVAIVLIALLWPLWLLKLFCHSDDKGEK